MELNIERLHKVHFGSYERRIGETTYVFDSILRTIQMDDTHTDIVMLSYNSVSTANLYKKMFKDFLKHQQEVVFEDKGRYVLMVNGTRILFTGYDYFNRMGLGDSRDYYLFTDF